MNNIDIFHNFAVNFDKSLKKDNCGTHDEDLNKLQDYINKQYKIPTVRLKSLPLRDLISRTFASPFQFRSLCLYPAANILQRMTSYPSTERF